MKIEDGGGTGRAAKIDSGFRLTTFAVTEPEDKHVNREGRAWAYRQSTTTVAVTDFVFYFKNTGEIDLAITDVQAFVGTATTLTIEVVAGTAGGSTSALSPTPRNLGSSQAPEATALESADITGITGAGELYLQRCAVVNTQYDVVMSSNIIIPQGQAIGIRSSVAAAVDCLVSVVGLDS